MKQLLVITFVLWFTGNITAQTKWIAHKSHSGNMSTFTLASPDNLGLNCGRGDFLEMKASNFDVLGNECTKPLQLSNGMVIKDPKLDSVGFAKSHKEINKLAQADSANYYPYKKVYDSINAVYYPTITTPMLKNTPNETKQQEQKASPTKKQQKKTKLKKDTTSSALLNTEPLRNSQTIALSRAEPLVLAKQKNKTTFPITLLAAILCFGGLLYSLKRIVISK